jgi:hypothetical protein
MNAADKFSIIFGQEELLYLLRSLGLPDLPGMGDRPWGEIKQETAIFILDAVGRSLFARGVVSFDSHGEITVDRVVIAMLTASAYAKQSVLLTYQGKDGGTLQYVYYRVPEFDVRQHLIFDWVYGFELQTNTDLGRQSVEEWIAPIDTQFSTGVIQVASETFDRAREAATTGGASLSIPILEAAGIEKNITQELSAALAEPILSLRFQSVNAESNPVRRNVFSILAGGNTCWLLTSDATIGTLSFKAIGSSELHRIVTTAYLSFEEKTNG